MYLEVVFDDGTTLDVGLSTTHTIQILGTTGSIENAFCPGGVKAVHLHHGEPPTAEQAKVEAQPDLPAADVVTGTITQGQTLTATDGTWVDADGNPSDPAKEYTAAYSPPVAEDTESPVVTDGTPPLDPIPPDAAQSAAEALADTGEPNALDHAAAPDPEPESVGPSPEQVAQAAAVTVDTAKTVAADPALPDDDKQHHVAQALADLETALDRWPDSAELADAKQELEQLDASLTATETT